MFIRPFVRPAPAYQPTMRPRPPGRLPPPWLMEQRLRERLTPEPRTPRWYLAVWW